MIARCLLDRVNGVSDTRPEALYISEVAVEWHEIMILQRSMRPSIARISQQLNSRCCQQTCHRLT